jgi:thioredoxin reductase (NADPH)
MRLLILALLFCLKAFASSVVILGGGIAALTAAVQVAQAGIEPIVIAGPTPGGIIIQSQSVQNWPGEPDITGYALADKLQKQAEAKGVKFLPGSVVKVDFKKRPFTLTVADGEKKETITATTCIIATGATPKLLGIPGEKENLFTKIFTCAPCDGLRFKGKTVAVIGGGDGAVAEASYLANLAKKVFVVVRKDHFRATQAVKKEALLARQNVEVLYETAVTAVKQNQDGLTLQLTSGKNLNVGGAFLAIGQTPNTALFKGELKLDQEGYIVVQNNQETSVPAVFAAGDVCDKHFRQAMTAAGDATKAALGACALTPSQEKKAPTEITSLSNLSSVITTSSKPTVVYFYSPSCGPCRAFHPTYAKWAEQFQDKASFVKLSSEESLASLTYYRIESVPTVLILNAKGEEIFRASSIEKLSDVPKLLK